MYQLNSAKTDEISLKAAYVGLAVLLLMCPLYLVINAWCICTVWGWFFVPWGLPALPLMQGVGVVLLWNVVAIRPPLPKSEIPVAPQLFSSFCTYIGACCFLIAAASLIALFF